mgnify:CR=1 FL=1
MAQSIPLTNDARARYLQRVPSRLNCVPEPERIAAQIVSDAIGETPLEQVAIGAGMSAGSRPKIGRWMTADCSPGLVHLVRLAASKPSLVEAIARALLSLCTKPRHVARAMQDRVCHALQELGHVSHEVTMALADGAVDEQERRAIRREIQHARDVLDQLERDVDAQVRR